MTRKQQCAEYYDKVQRTVLYNRNQIGLGVREGVPGDMPCELGL